MHKDTKSMIANTLFELLDKNPSQKISVKQLIEACGISRQIFYYYYQDIFDVLEYGLEKRQEILVQNFKQSNYNEEEIQKIFIYQSLQSIRCIEVFLDSNHRKETEHIIYKRMRNFIESLFKNCTNEIKLPISNGKENEFYIDFLAAAGMQYMLMSYEENTFDSDFFFQQWFKLFKYIGLL